MSKGLTRIYKAIGYSWQGLCAAFRSEAAFRQELMLMAVALPIACLLEVTTAERAMLIGSLFLILIVELINTAIETIIERISPEIHPLSKKAKDLGSAVVFVAILNAVVMWGIILA